MKFSKIIAILCCVFLLIMASEKSFGQSVFSKKNMMNQYTSLSVGIGTSNYFGDLSPYNYFYYGLITTVRWNASVNYTKYLTSRIGMRFGFTWARISGDDFSYSKHDLEKFQYAFGRNLHFRNDVKEFSIVGIYNLLDQDGSGSMNRNNITPYIFGGVGLIGHNPEARIDPTVNSDGSVTLGAWTSLKDQTTSGQLQGSQYPTPYSLVALVVPVGIGLRMKINQKFDFSAEVGFRLSSTDYLDDTGYAKYPNPQDLPTDISRQLAARGGLNYDPRTGESRVASFQKLLAINGIQNTSLTPNQIGDTGYATGSYRGGPHTDSYLLTQFSIHYIISNDIKCPVIK